MICYKDKTFCSSDCVNTSCHRNWTQDKQNAAIKWWGSDNPPIAFCDWSQSCPDYKS